MRNLKKILALVLALVMSFSLMATANAFTDDEQITDTYETAVTVLDGLKVFQGYDDGSFQPQSPIRRSEVAAIIYRIVTGDVTDAQVGIYADYNKFDDVKSTSWYAGYVNFCANAEYIKGRDARTFDPDSYVTGYEALAMILRAIGYDKNGEFTGSSWQVQTAATGELRGITKNITAGTLGTYASREVVAEILFQTILVDKVNYTPAFGYQLDDTSLGWDTFELESIEGVVVANEYADLYGTKPMKAGRTEMDVDGDSYVIDYSTTLEDIGENHAAYITEGKNVLAIAKTGNTVFETGAEADIKTTSKFEDVTGLERDEDTTEYFLNFDGGDEYKSSDWKISYVLKFANETAAQNWVDNYSGSAADSDVTRNGVDVTVEFGRNDVISRFDMNCIEFIFDEADKEDENSFVDGEVYVGTQSITDISDEYSYNQFLDKYIDTDENGIKVEDNENGNWLKVVDVDGDGVADYVMKTIYTAAQVEDINRDDEIELDVLDHLFTDGDALNEVDDDIDIVTEDELGVGDVVYYAVIDDNAYTYLADVVTAEIDKVDRNDRIATTTDGDEYIESDVHNHIQDDDVYMDGVKGLEGDVSYDLYLDKYGYLVAYAYSATTGDFALLTDGWFMAQRSGDEYAAMVWDGEDLVDTTLTDGGELFIEDKDNNRWGQLREINGINNGGHEMTTLVGSLNEDGEIVPVDEAFTRQNVRIIATENDVIPENSYTTGTSYVTTAKATKAYDDVDEAAVEVRALSTTTYYYVYEDGGDVIVDEYVGYANLPDLAEGDEDYIEDVYVVGTETNRGSGLGDATYYTANIVVVEFNNRYRADAEQIFLVDLPVVASSVKKEDARVIRENGAEETVTIDLSKSDVRGYDPAGNKVDENGQVIMPGLYYMWETADEGTYIIEAMDHDDIAANRYTVGQVITTWGTGAYDYTEVSAFSYDSWTNHDDTVTGATPEYRITEDSALYDLSYSFDEDDDYIADLVKDDVDEVLDERVDETTKVEREAFEDEDGNGVWNRGEDSWNYNDVLVRYNSDDDIVYAISFANLDDDDLTNFAQYVWNWAKPLADVVVPTVSFYGQDPVSADANDEFTDTVSYAVAKANEALDPNAIRVNNGEIVLGDETTDVTTAGDTYTGTILGDDGEYYTFTLTQGAASDTTVLESNHASIVINPKNGAIGVNDKKMSIQEFESHLSAADNAKIISYEYTNAQGAVTDKSQTLSNVSTVKITVQSESGKYTQLYQFTAEAEADEKQQAIEDALELLNKAAEARVDFILTIAEQNNLSLTAADKEDILDEMADDLAGYENQIKTAANAAAVKALIEEQEADADGMIIKGTLADLVKGAGWNAATKISNANKQAAQDEQTNATYKGYANAKAAAYLEAIKEALKASINWDGTRTVEACVNDRLTAMGNVADPLNPGQNINKAECTVTVTAPDSVSFTGDHGTAQVTVTIEVTNVYGTVVSDVHSAEVDLTFTW